MFNYAHCRRLFLYILNSYEFNRETYIALRYNLPTLLVLHSEFATFLNESYSLSQEHRPSLARRAKIFVVGLFNLLHSLAHVAALNPRCTTEKPKRRACIAVVG